MLERFLLTQSFSSPMTVLHVIEMLQLRAPQSTPMRILLVGADCEEDQPWIEVLPYLPYSLDLVLVGPRLQDAAWEDVLEPLNRRICYTTHGGLLQDVEKDLGEFSLIFALNSGMIFYPSWKGAFAR